MKNMTLAVSCINSDSNVPTINKYTISWPCGNKNKIYKEKIEAFEGQKRAAKKLIKVGKQ